MMMINMAVIKPIWHWPMADVWSPLLSGRIRLDDVGGCHSVRMTSRTSGLLTSGGKKDIGWVFKYLT